MGEGLNGVCTYWLDNTKKSMKAAPAVGKKMALNGMESEEGRCTLCMCWELPLKTENGKHKREITFYAKKILLTFASTLLVKS